MSRFLIKGEVRELETGEVMFTQGQPMSRDEKCVFIVMDGRMHLVRKLASGRILSNVVRRGVVFGVESSFSKDSETWEFTAVATQDSKIYCWTRSDYEMIVGTYAEIAKDTIVDQSRWLRKINQIVSAIDHGEPPTERLITL